MNARTAYIIMT